MKSQASIGKGVLYPRVNAEKFEIQRFPASKKWESFVKHLWTVSWDLGDSEPLLQETLPYPAVHIVFETQASEIVGVIEGRFQREVVGKSRVFGIHFHPGGFYPLIAKQLGDQKHELQKWALGEWTDQRLPIGTFFDLDPRAAEQRIFSNKDPKDMAKEVWELLDPFLPEPDLNASLAQSYVEEVQRDRSITQVQQLLTYGDLSLRSLQRLFHRYVGLSPKWVIQRTRMQEATERVHSENFSDFAGLAFDLGYSDQSHFVRDFRRVVGCTPAQYLKRNRIHDT